MPCPVCRYEHSKLLPKGKERKESQRRVHGHRREGGLQVEWRRRRGRTRRRGPSRGRVLIPLEDLGPNGDLIDWLRVGAKGDPATFRSILERALATSPTPWALQIQRLPSDLPPWDLEDHDGVRDLLCELGHQGPLSRDAHLRLLAERCGVTLATLQEATREIAQAREPSTETTSARSASGEARNPAWLSAAM